MTQKLEQSPYETLIREGLALEKKIQRAKATEESARFQAITATWAWADWIVVNVTPMSPKEAGRLGCAMRYGKTFSPSGLSLTEYAERSGYTQPLIGRYRRTAAAFPPEVRVPGASLDLCARLLTRFGQDVAAAVEAMPGAVAGANAGLRTSAGTSKDFRSTLTRVKRLEIRTFADLDRLLEVLARLGEKASEAVVDLDLSDEERATLAKHRSRIEAQLAPFPEMPKRRRSWLRAA